MFGKLFKNWPLRRQIFLLTGCTIMMVGLLAAEFARNQETASFKRNFNYQTQKLVSMLSATSLDAILSEDRPVLDTIIAQLVENDSDVEEVTILNENEEVLNSWSKADSTATVAEKIDYSHDVLVEGESFGKISVSWNVAKQTAEIHNHVKKLYLYGIGISALLALVVITLINQIVVKPINAIDRHLRLLQQNKATGEFKLEAAKELVNLGDSVNELGSTLALRKRREAELEEASRAKSEFLANMSHELRTPMNGVLGMLSLLKETQLNPEQSDQIKVATSSGRSLLRLINDILDFSKVEAGKLEYESIAFCLEELIDDSADVMAEQAHRKSLELISHIEPTVQRELVGDPTRIRQVVTNLASNAVKFTDEGEIQIQVETLETNDSQSTLRFSITDTGVGIASEKIDSIFDSFAQADGSTTRKYGGTGLGLAISRRFVEGMGGKIGATSQPGVGSTFWFELPLSHSEDNAPIATAQPELDQLKCLLLETNPASQSNIHELLSAQNMHVDCQTNGNTALQMLREATEHNEPYDVILFNSNLNDMPGDVFARCVEGDPVFDSVKLVSMTYVTHTIPELYPHKNPRITAQVSKPIKRSDLLRILSAVATGQKITNSKDMAVNTGKLEAYAGINILVVEDNAVNQEVALGMLNKIGFQAEVADNGQEGLDALANGNFDLVLMDCQMPVLDGYAATAEIRKREGGVKHTPIIALTANAMTGDAEKCLAAGMDDYLSKPFEPDALEEKLIFWLSTRLSELTIDPSAKLAA